MVDLKYSPCLSLNPFHHCSITWLEIEDPKMWLDVSSFKSVRKFCIAATITFSLPLSDLVLLGTSIKTKMVLITLVATATEIKLKTYILALLLH